MFWNILQFVFGRRAKNDALTTEDMNRMDVAFEDVLTVFDCEKVMVEEGEVVGETAIINDKKQLELTEGRLPASVPKASFFDRENEELIKAGLCTSFLHIEVSLPGGRIQRHFGTAFFIDKKHLITAGHNTYIKEGTIKKIQITYPGLWRVNYTQLLDGKICTIDCTEVKSLYSKQGPYERDIALLHAGSHNAADFLQLSPELPKEIDDDHALVDVIGYPGELKSEWMRTQKDIKDVDQSLDDVAKLLPKRTLTVTRGVLKSIGKTVSYDLSTCPGMSGSCVLYKGKVIGVHIGQPNTDGSLPSAVPLTPEIVSVLRAKKSNLITKSP